MANWVKIRPHQHDGCPNRIKSQKKGQFPFFLSRDTYICLCLYVGGHDSRAFSLWWFYQSGPPTSVKWSESHSVMSNSLRPNGLYSPWNSPGQTTGVGNLSRLQGIFLTQGLNPGLPHCGRILYQSTWIIPNWVEKSSVYSDNFAILSLPTVEEHFPTDQTS